MADLADAVVERLDPNGVRIGIVDALSPDLLITVNGGSVKNPGVLRGFSPQPGQNVSMLRQGNTWLVLGTVDGPANGGAREVEIHSRLGSNFAVTTSEVTFASVTWDYRQGDVLRVEVNGETISNGADRQTIIRLKENGITFVTRQTGSPTNNFSSPFQGANIRRGLPPGIITYSATCQMNAFSGNVQADTELSVILL